MKGMHRVFVVLLVVLFSACCSHSRQLLDTGKIKVVATRAYLEVEEVDPLVYLIDGKANSVWRMVPLEKNDVAGKGLIEIIQIQSEKPIHAIVFEMSSEIDPTNVKFLVRSKEKDYPIFWGDGQTCNVRFENSVNEFTIGYLPPGKQSADEVISWPDVVLLDKSGGNLLDTTRYAIHLTEWVYTHYSIWRTADWMVLREFNDPGISMMQFSPDGERLLALYSEASFGSGVKVFSIPSFSEKQYLEALFLNYEKTSWLNNCTIQTESWERESHQLNVCE